MFCRRLYSPFPSCVSGTAEVCIKPAAAITSQMLSQIPGRCKSTDTAKKKKKHTSEVAGELGYTYSSSEHLGGLILCQGNICGTSSGPISRRPLLELRFLHNEEEKFYCFVLIRLPNKEQPSAIGTKKDKGFVQSTNNGF